MDSQQVGRLSGALGGTLKASPSRSPSCPPSLLWELQAIQVAAQAFVAGGPAALMVEICRLLREGLEAEEADPARLAQVTAALESLIRLGQPLEPVVAIARTLRQQRDTLQQHAHQYYNLSMAAQGEARTAQQELKEAQAAWAQERAALQEQAQKVKRLVAVAAKWGATSQ